MKITKFGHSCLLIEENGARILIDPGNYSILQNAVTDIDAIFITHEHNDHCDTASIKTIVERNSGAPVHTNEGVGKKLAAAGIQHELFLDGQKTMVKGVLVEGVGKKHATIYPTWPELDNTGYRIGGRLFHTGDSLSHELDSVEILALPMIAPWMRVAEGIDFAKHICPRFVLPIHDGMIRSEIRGIYHDMYKNELAQSGIGWLDIEDGQMIEV